MLGMRNFFIQSQGSFFLAVFDDLTTVRLLIQCRAPPDD